MYVESTSYFFPVIGSITGEGGIWSVERIKNWPERLEQLFVLNLPEIKYITIATDATCKN